MPPLRNNEEYLHMLMSLVTVALAPGVVCGEVRTVDVVDMSPYKSAS